MVSLVEMDLIKSGEISDPKDGTSLKRLYSQPWKYAPDGKKRTGHPPPAHRG
jgi:hypothetical protein